MKNNLTLLVALAATLFLNQSFAQCSFSIPPSPGHIKISSDQTVVDIDGSVYWICNGVTVTVSSSAGSIFLMEEGSTLIINDTDGDAIYAKDNCSITDNSSESLSIFKNASATVTNNGGMMNLITTCSPVVFDYSLSGPPNCTVGINEIATQVLKIYPTLIKSNDRMFIDHSLGIDRLDVYDLSGKLVYQVRHLSSQELVLPAIPSGYYSIIAEDNSGKTYRNRFVVTD